MLKILVADSTKELCAAIADAFDGRYAISVCHDGKTALDRIRTLQPDILWLDLMLPGMDGITILRAASMAGLCPKVIAASRYVNELIQMDLAELGICYLLSKPCSTAAALSRIEAVAKTFAPGQNKGHKAPEELIYEILLLLGDTGNRGGHSCLQEAVRIKTHDRQAQITKTVYPDVAAICDGTAKSVDKAIQRVINTAWEKRDLQIWRLYFPEYVDKCPSNGVFVERVAEFVRNQLQNAEEETDPSQ